MASKPPGWKAFGSDTEAGRLLQKLYGKNNRPKIHYPTPKRMEAEARRPFCPAGGLPGSDARIATRREVTINLPRPPPAEMRRYTPAIDFHSGRRKHVKDISAEQDELHRYRQSYRPARAPAVSTDANKRKLQTRFQFGGGKALPEAGLLAPLQAVSAEDEARMKTTRAKPKTEQDLFDTILQEITDQQNLLAELEKRNDFSRHDSIKACLQRKVKDLETLDKLMNKT